MNSGPVPSTSIHDVFETVLASRVPEVAQDCIERGLPLCAVTPNPNGQSVHVSVTIPNLPFIEGEPINPPLYARTIGEGENARQIICTGTDYSYDDIPPPEHGYGTPPLGAAITLGDFLRTPKGKIFIATVNSLYENPAMPPVEELPTAKKDLLLVKLTLQERGCQCVQNETLANSDLYEMAGPTLYHVTGYISFNIPGKLAREVPKLLSILEGYVNAEENVGRINHVRSGKDDFYQLQVPIGDGEVEAEVERNFLTFLRSFIDIVEQPTDIARQSK